MIQKKKGLSEQITLSKGQQEPVPADPAADLSDRLPEPASDDHWRHRPLAVAQMVCTSKLDDNKYFSVNKHQIDYGNDYNCNNRDQGSFTEDA